MQTQSFPYPIPAGSISCFEFRAVSAYRRQVGFVKSGMKKTLFLVICLIVVAAALPGARGATVRVLMGQNFFSPNSISIAVGDSVFFTNTAGAHNVIGYNPASEPFCGPTVRGPGPMCTVTFNSAGTYQYRCVPHSFGSGTSYSGMIGVVTVTNVPVPMPPIVNITSPTAGAIFVAPASFTFSAVSSDSDGSVSNLQFFVNDSSLGVSSGGQFSTSVGGLGVGEYTLTAVATDNQGLKATNTVNIVVQQAAPVEFSLSVAVNPAGAGTALVTPAPNTNGLYFAGMPVALSAQPQAGFRFTYWSGTVFSANPLLLVMTNDMSVTANFEAIPTLDFAQAAGTFSGLLVDEHDTNNDYATSGFLRVRVSAGGAFHGMAIIGGQRDWIAGHFDLFGYAPLVARRASLLGSLQIDSTGSRITGSLTDYRNPNPSEKRIPGLLLYRSTATTNAAELSNSYSIEFPSRDPVVEPGMASIFVFPDGRVRLRGMLGDRTLIVDRTFLSVDGRIPLFVPLYHHRGSILGWLDVAADGSVQGTARWFRPADSRSVHFPAGFALDIPVFGSRGP